MTDAAPEAASAPQKKSAPRASQYGIKVETHAYVGSYETAVLQAKDGKDLARWLKRFHYRVTPEVEALMVEYVAKKWRFFVARVDGKQLAKGKTVRLTPLRLRLATEKIVLPIRMAGAGHDTPRDIVVTVVGSKGVATSTSHDLTPLATSVEIPTAARGVAGPLHKSIVARALDRAGDKPVAVVERTGRLPLDAASLKKLGASDKSPFATRVHTLVDRRAAHDLSLAIGDDRAELVVSYVEWSPWQPATGAKVCAAGERYLDTVGPRVDAALVRLQELAGVDRDAHVARAFPNGLVRAAPSPAPPPPDAAPNAKPKKSPIESWQIAAGLGVFVVLLIGYGRFRRAS
jgi:hypothetical protein